MIAARIASFGYNVVGIDRSYEMIDLAQERRSGHNNLSWRCADFMISKEHSGCDALLMLYSLVQTMGSAELQHKCLLKARETIVKNGLLFLECVNDEVSRKTYLSNVWYNESYGAWKVQSRSSYTPEGVMLLDITVRTRTPSGSVATFNHVLMPASKQSVGSMLGTAGFAPLEWRGAPNYDSPFASNTSPGLLVVARRL